MNIFLLYLLLAKATLTTFSGLASLPVLREDFVITPAVQFELALLVVTRNDGFARLRTGKRQ